MSKIMTVSGPIEPAELGFTLHHEHIMSTFGAEAARYPTYDRDALAAAVLPYLAKLKSLGVRAIVDCTAAYFGRHPELLRDFSAQSGLQLITNTGYYGAANGRYIPAHAYTESAEQIAGRWTREWAESIDETGVYPGFIKTAVGDGLLNDIARKLIQAAAITHRQTGLVIQTHTGDNAPAAREILSILKRQGVDPSAWIWVHAHSLTDMEPAVWAAEQGAWVSLDGLNASSAEHILEMLQAFKAAGLLQRALLSHDGDIYCMGQTRPFHYLLTDFLPALRGGGFTEEDIHQLTITNPVRAYAVD